LVYFLGLVYLLGFLNYTVVHKTGHYIIGDNFVKCEPIFTTFALLRRKLNFQRNSCNIPHFT